MDLRRPSRYFLRCLLSSLLLSVSGVAAANAAPYSEYEVKAAFLYNFTKFVEWPATASPSLTLCVLNQDPFGPALDRLEGKSSANGPLQVKRIHGAGEAGGCRLVFIAAENSIVAGISLTALDDSPILTIGDVAGFADRGGMIGLYLEDGKIVFDINLAAARAAGITISSRVLHLARRVYGMTP
ncbi:conserved exported hypothetical protein [Gammaproteobacteria bacterium]